LKKAKDIKAVFARRDVFRGKRLIFYRAETSAERYKIRSIGKRNTVDIHRFCLMVPKGCGSAVRRNRIKRVLREIVRNNRHRIETGYDYIIRVEPTELKDIDIRQEIFFGDFENYFGWN
jgi:ribonuclease P protein component